MMPGPPPVTTTYSTAVRLGCDWRPMPRELASRVVVVGLGQEPLGPRHFAGTPRIVRDWPPGPLGATRKRSSSVAPLGDPRAAEDDDRRGDIVLVKRHLRLEQFQLQPHGAQLAPGQQRDVLFGQHVAGRIENGLHIAFSASFMAVTLVPGKICEDLWLTRAIANASRFNSTLCPIFGTSVFQPRSRRSSSARDVALVNSPCVRNTCRGGWPAVRASGAIPSGRRVRSGPTSRPRPRAPARRAPNMRNVLAPSCRARPRVPAAMKPPSTIVLSDRGSRCRK